MTDPNPQSKNEFEEFDLGERILKKIGPRKKTIYKTLCLEFCLVVIVLFFFGPQETLNTLQNSRLVPLLILLISSPYGFFIWLWRTEDKLTELEITLLDKKRELVKFNRLQDLEAERRLNEIRKVLTKPIDLNSQEFYLQAQRLVRYWEGDLGQEAQQQAVALIIERYQQFVNEDKEPDSTGKTYLKKLWV